MNRDVAWGLVLVLFAPIVIPFLFIKGIWDNGLDGQAAGLILVIFIGLALASGAGAI